jgi:hypothetical protein
LEIAFNLVWLGVSLALVVSLGTHVLRAGGHRGAAAVALICLVCFLFPVISVTDDLYCSEPAMLEPSKVKKLVVSAAVVLNLLPWTDLQRPQENCGATLEYPSGTRRPQKEVFPFHLSRRPPPPRLASA